MNTDTKIVEYFNILDGKLSKKSEHIQNLVDLLKNMCGSTNDGIFDNDDKQKVYDEIHIQKQELHIMQTKYKEKHMFYKNKICEFRQILSKRTNLLESIDKETSILSNSQELLSHFSKKQASLNNTMVKLEAKLISV